MQKLISSFLVIYFLFATAFGMWAHIPLEVLITDSDLIVIGTLHSAIEDSSGIGQGYINVEEIVFGRAMTDRNESLRIGDDLKIAWQDNWACAAGMHMSRVGRKGIWLLTVNDDGTVNAGYPGRFSDDSSEFDEIRRLKKKKARTISVITETVEPSSVQAMSVDVEEVPIVRVDLSPYPDYSLYRAGGVFLLSLFLYWLLYRSGFRLRKHG